MGYLFLQGGIFDLQMVHFMHGQRQRVRGTVCVCVCVCVYIHIYMYIYIYIHTYIYIYTYIVSASPEVLHPCWCKQKAEQKVENMWINQYDRYDLAKSGDWLWKFQTLSVSLLALEHPKSCVLWASVHTIHTDYASYICIYMYIYIHIYIHTHTQIYVWIYIHICIYV